jgi:hypothetical protein
MASGRRSPVAARGGRTTSGLRRGLLGRTGERASRPRRAAGSISIVGDAIGQLLQRILDFLTPILSPDWGALVGLMPVFLVIGVVGPAISLLALGWFIYVVRRPRSRIPYVAPAPVPARLVEGTPQYPSGEPYCPVDQLVYPFGSTHCERCGRDLAVRCPKCGTGREATIDTCGVCGLVLKIAPRMRQLQTVGPPPGGAAAA